MSDYRCPGCDRETTSQHSGGDANVPYSGRLCSDCYRTVTDSALAVREAKHNAAVAAAVRAATVSAPDPAPATSGGA